MRTMDLHHYLWGMSPLCYCYINPQITAQEGFEPPKLTMKMLCLNYLTIEPSNIEPSASIDLTSSDYKTGALLLC